jgi:hypothetical protein
MLKYYKTPAEMEQLTKYKQYFKIIPKNTGKLPHLRAVMVNCNLKIISKGWTPQFICKVNLAC